MLGPQGSAVDLQKLVNVSNQYAPSDISKSDSRVGAVLLQSGTSFMCVFISMFMAIRRFLCYVVVIFYI